MQWSGFDQADIVVEAVFELPDLKREVLAQAAESAPNALITSNTSAIGIDSLATAVRDPSRFMGTHFFSPVERMPLVELVPHAGTAPEAIATARNLARAMGKCAVVVADSPGFFTSRVYARWLIEGLRMLLCGVTPASIEAGARLVGFPIGPLQAHDEATLELVRQASIAQVADQVMRDRLEIDEVTGLLGRLIDAGIEGRRQGNGFYTYESGRRSGFNPQVAGLVDSGSVRLSPEQAGDRLMLAFVTECLLAWDEGVLCHPDDGDVAGVLGIGFPRHLGGPFHWVDRQGADWVLDRCRALGITAFPPGTTLPRLAQEHRVFADEPRRPRPGISRSGRRV